MKFYWKKYLYFFRTKFSYKSDCSHLIQFRNMDACNLIGILGQSLATNFIVVSSYYSPNLFFFFFKRRSFVFLKNHHALTPTLDMDRTVSQNSKPKKFVISNTQSFLRKYILLHSLIIAIPT